MLADRDPFICNIGERDAKMWENRATEAGSGLEGLANGRSRVGGK
jgi:hypothetical protein